MSLYALGKGATYVLVRALFKMEYTGLENIPAGGGYILASNHRSNFDPMVIAHKIKPQVHYLAKDELLSNPVSRLIISNLGVVPVKRGQGDTQALAKAGEYIHAGGVIGIFPEGRRAKDGVPLRPRSGVSIIAGQTGADILPVGVTYHGGVRAGSRVSVRYGPLIPNARLGIDPDCPSSIKASSRIIMDEILGLVQNIPGGA